MQRSLLITSNQKQETSQWTLDYPPFFAFFERFWSRFAFLVNPAITRLDNLEYSEWTAVAFQRTTVVLSELVLAAALLRSGIHQKSLFFFFVSVN
jgi:alpha-1,3-glucosyltransferase